MENATAYATSYSTSLNAVSPHRPLMIWATPRSVSTAFQKCFAAIDGAHIVHEPYTACYYFSADRRSDRYGSQPVSVASEPEDVDRAMMQYFQSSRYPFVVSKELAFQGAPYVSDRVLQSARHVFITRAPGLTYCSLVKLKPDFTEDEFGFTALKRIYHRVRQFQRRVPVVDGSDFRRYPDRVLQRISDFLGLDYSEKMLKWQTGGIRLWDEHEKQCQAIWHRTLECSTTILPEPSRADERVDIAPEHINILTRADAIYHDLIQNGRC